MLQPQFQDEFVFTAQEFSSFSSGIITSFKRKVCEIKSQTLRFSDLKSCTISEREEWQNQLSGNSNNKPKQ